MHEYAFLMLLSIAGRNFQVHMKDLGGHFQEMSHWKADPSSHDQID